MWHLISQDLEGEMLKLSSIQSKAVLLPLPLSPQPLSPSAGQGNEKHLPSNSGSP